ncbi:hypothetical protein [Streptomyces inhibens]|nr:hypothetical protein [Streptomyces inhibens]
MDTAPSAPHDSTGTPPSARSRRTVATGLDLAADPPCGGRTAG